MVWSFWGIGLTALLGFFTLIWLVSLQRRDASIVDRVWGLSFALQGIVYTALAPELDWRRALMLGLVSVWGVRLSVHIHLRNRGHPEDYRYQAMRAEHGPKKFWWYSFFSVFALQGLLSGIIGLPLMIVGYQSGPVEWTPFDGLGIFLWCVGFYFEAVGDWQLRVFKAEPANKGKLLTSGLWSLTRHPNYFGDALLWWGYFAIALSVPGGYFTAVGPLLMTFFIRKVSGVSLLEKDLVRKKPGYEDYIRSTPAFVPRLGDVVRYFTKRGSC